jgi:DNA-binding MarR family transcriptional regulator
MRAEKQAKPDRRAEVIEKLEVAGRALSTAAVLFHTAVAAKVGLSATEEKTLDLLDRFGPLTAGELAHRMSFAPASVTGLVNRLERKRFARRVADPNDRRRVRIERVPESITRFVPLFTDLVVSLRQLYDRYTTAQLELILDFLMQATRRQQDATAKLTGGDS